MKNPRLVSNEERGEGWLIFPKEWEDYDALLRCDLLKDWLHEIDYAYEKAMRDFRSEFDLMRASAIRRDE